MSRREAQEASCAAVQTCPILGKSAASVATSDGWLDDPTLGQNGKPFRRIRPLNDRDVDLPADARQSRLEPRSLGAAVGREFAREWGQVEARAHRQNTAITILDIGG